MPSRQLLDARIEPTAVVTAIAVVVAISKSSVRHTEGPTVESCRPEDRAHEEVEEQQRRQREDSHLDVGTHGHLDSTKLQRPRFVPEALASHGMRPAASNSSKHRQEHRRGEHEHEQHRHEDEGIVWAERLGICEHILLQVNLQFAPSGSTPHTLHGTPKANTPELVPRAEVTSRGICVRTHHVAREIQELPAVLCHQLRHGARSKLAHDVCRCQTAEGET
mmetsp:Transcript_92489/g.260799  ORF Transcript_92489/g.260799 Transcript_92489/m.260799 type:complete len:221 (+) Transcript_92489:170-832(+)